MRKLDFIVIGMILLMLALAAIGETNFIRLIGTDKSCTPPADALMPACWTSARPVSPEAGGK